MKSELFLSYKTTSGLQGSVNYNKTTTVSDIKEQLAQMLKTQPNNLSISIPNIKSLSNDQTIFSLNLKPPVCILVSTEISEIPTLDYYNQLKKKLNTKDLSAFTEIVEEWEESFDPFLLLDSSNDEGWTLLHYGCYKGIDNIVEYLVNRGAMCNSESEDMWTPLQLACYNGYTLCVKHLLNHPRLQINRITERGTALHQACRKGQSDILHLLLEAGASMRIEDTNGLIPLQVAVNQEVFEILPLYMGKSLIKKLKADDNDSIDQIEDLIVIENQTLMLTSSIYSGELIISYYEDNVITSEYKTIKIIDIYGFRETSPTHCVMQGKFGVLEFRHNNCREFIMKTEKLIDHCHCNKIGYTVSSEISIPIFTRRPTNIMPVQKVSLHNFYALSKLSSSSFYKYYSVYNADTLHSFIIKQIPKAKIHNLNKTIYFVRESKLLQHIRHAFVAKLYYAFQTRDNLYMVFENCKNNLMSEIKHAPISIENAKTYVAQIILALEFLHSRDVVYRNLNPNNIWLDLNGNIKLLNFELAKENVNISNKTKSFVGTLGYIAPEHFSKNGHEKPADIYALGPCLYFMLTGQPLFNSKTVKDFVQDIKLSYFSLPANFPGEIKDFIIKVMNKDPNLRPNLNMLKKHSWLRDVNWDEIAKKKSSQNKRSFLPSKDNESPDHEEGFRLEEENDDMFSEVEDFDYSGNLS